jgi:hypothetical protein
MTSQIHQDKPTLDADDPRGADPPRLKNSEAVAEKPNVRMATQEITLPPGLPRTAANVRRLMNQAIDVADFETARGFAQEAESLDLYDRELRLAETVHTYYDQKKRLSDTMYHDAHLCETATREKEAKLRHYYWERFQEMKKRQETELNSVIEKWQQTRDQIAHTIEDEYHNTVDMAKLLARDQKFDEAIRVRNEAEIKFHKRASKKIDALDLYFQNQCDTLLKAQQREIALLEKEREAELTRLTACLDTWKRELGRRFRAKNAAQVVSMAVEFPPGAAMPRALQQQTVRGRPGTPPPEPEEDQVDIASSARSRTEGEIGRLMGSLRQSRAVVRKPLLIGTPADVTRLPNEDSYSEEEAFGKPPPKGKARRRRDV